MTAPLANPPFLVALNLTRRCNLACAHCYLDAGTRRDGAGAARPVAAVNILCNLPLECFEDRRRFGQRIVTFGPPDRMWVDGTEFRWNKMEAKA